MEAVLSRHFTEAGAHKQCSILRREVLKQDAINPRKRSSGWRHVHHDVRHADKGLKRWHVVES